MARSTICTLDDREISIDEQMKDTPPIIMVVNSRNKMDILKSASFSVHDKYFQDNSEAYGNLQDEEFPQEDPAISCFMGDA